MTEKPTIFDRALLRTRLRRAMAQQPATFLLERVAEDFVDRLSVVKRDFVHAADIGTPGDTLRARLAANGKIAPLVPVPLGDDEVVGAQDGSLDLAVSALALQFVNDLPGVLVQIRRALKPDGLFLAALAGGDTLTELRQAFAQAESRGRGRRVAARRAVCRPARPWRLAAAHRLRPAGDRQRARHGAL